MSRSVPLRKGCLSVTLLATGLLASSGAGAQVFEVRDGTLHEVGAAKSPEVPIRPRSPVPLAAAAALAAERHDVAPALVDVVIRRESGYNAKVRSRAGALGLMQLMPNTARQLGIDPRNPISNLDGGSAYLRDQLDRFGGRIDLALAAYNAGPRAVRRYGGVPPYRETQAYVAASLDRLADISLALPKPDLGSLP